MFNYSKLPDKYIDRKSQVVKKKSVVSIITPFYNAGATLMQTVNSVLSQTYPYYEWIIVDDGSKDKKSLHELEKVSKLDERIKVYHKENGGPSQARDYGISKSSKSSKYIYFLDADDMIDSTMIECLYFALESHKEASFAYTSMVNFGAKEFIWDKYLTVSKEKEENLICISSMVRKEDLLEVGCFGIKEKAMYEDWNLWLKLIAAGKRPLRINAPLFWYRTSNSGELSRALDNHKAAMKYVNETASKIMNPVEIIQFPRIDNTEREPFDWKDSVYPQYKKDSKKTILFLIPWMIIGGADLFNLDILKRIDKKKFNTIVVTMLPNNNVLRQEFEEYSDFVYDLSSFLDRIDYPAFVNYLIKSRNVDTIFLSNCSYAYVMLPKIKNEYPNVSIIDYIHSIDQKAKRGGFGGYSRDFADLIDMTYTCNNFTTNQLKEKFSKNNVETLYIGTDHERFDSKKYNKKDLLKKYGIPEGKKVISYIARFSEEKRPELFVRIAKKISNERDDLVFLMAGSGNLNKNVERLILKYNLKDKVILVGATNTPEEIYAISDITVNCSRLEGLALTSYESLSMGVPVVSADVGGQKELIDDSVGKIVPYDQKLDLSTEIKNYVEAISYVLDNLNELKKNSRSKIVKNFNLNLTVKKIEEILLNINTNKSSTNNCQDLVYELYLNVLHDDYMWLCNEFMVSNYGVSLYHEIKEEDDANISLKQRIKNKLIAICNRFDIKDESIVILNLIRNVIIFARSFYYVCVFIAKSFLSVFKICIKMLKKIYKKYEEIINYIIVGVLTTVVSLGVKWGLLFTILDAKNPVKLQTAVIVSWICAVTFAYFANRIFVFKSKSKKIIKEIISFFSARILTLLMEMFIMWFFVTLLKLNSDTWVFIWTIVTQILVMVLNYVFSKLFVFKKKV